uniref:non-specific serine/threonine protein kinase n=1 Tax=Coturnix japonica TaxID=93934 RepID=A0A8C2TJ86_COTJA
VRRCVGEPITMAEGKIAGLYDLERTLGKGHFAVVKLARHVFTGQRVAVKVIDKSKLAGEAAGQVSRQLSVPSHPHGSPVGALRGWGSSRCPSLPCSASSPGCCSGTPGSERPWSRSRPTRGCRGWIRPPPAAVCCPSPRTNGCPRRSTRSSSRP